MIIEELLIRYGQNCYKGVFYSKFGVGIGEELGFQGFNGEVGFEDLFREIFLEENGFIVKIYIGFFFNSERGIEVG